MSRRRGERFTSARHRVLTGLALVVALAVAAATPEVSNGALAAAAGRNEYAPHLPSHPTVTGSTATAPPRQAPAITAAGTRKPLGPSGPGSTTQPGTASTTSIPPSTPTTTVAVDPFAGIGLYSSSWDRDGVSAADIAAAAPIFDQPQAEWLSGDESLPAVTSQVHTDVAGAQAADQMPVLVAYDIPDRDCGGYSVGGTADATDYAAWVDAVAAGIGDDRAAVILEPDALAQLGCLDAYGQQQRYAELRAAIVRLREEPSTAVYLDAGNANWQPASLMVSRLEDADVAAATGFSLNVSNFDTTTHEEAYGATLSGALGGEHFVVDTGRNGTGPPPPGDWCNPAGRGLGLDPTTASGDPLVDALLWVKNPGRSDGACGPGEPPAGKYWPSYAQGLLARAAD